MWSAACCITKTISSARGSRSDCCSMHRKFNEATQAQLTNFMATAEKSNMRIDATRTVCHKDHSLDTWIMPRFNELQHILRADRRQARRSRLQQVTQAYTVILCTRQHSRHVHVHETASTEPYCNQFKPHTEMSSRARTLQPGRLTR